MKKKFEQPEVRVIQLNTGIICTSGSIPKNPSEREHGDGPGNGVGWGPGGKPHKSVIFDED